MTATEDRERLARARAFMPPGTHHFLERRTLESDHRRLAEVLHPGMTVLDVGCGSGAITAGAAEAVGPAGRVVGVDLNEELVGVARERHSAPNLEFQVGSVHDLPARGAFDVVTCARLLLWLADPRSALAAMAGAVRPGGLVLVLDYNLAQIVWEPQAPAPALGFMAAFLRWRAEAGLDNSMASRLPSLLEAVGLADVRANPEPEVAQRGDADFDARIGLWPDVIATRGHQVVADGFIDEAGRSEAERTLREWARDRAQRQSLDLRAVEGRRPLHGANK